MGGWFACLALWDRLRPRKCRRREEYRPGSVAMCGCSNTAHAPAHLRMGWRGRGMRGQPVGGW